MKLHTSILLLALLGACQMPLAFQDPVDARADAGRQARGRFQTPATRSQTPAPSVVTTPSPKVVAATPRGADTAPGDPALLDWSGGVVAGPEEGAIRTVGGSPNHGLEPTIEGRSHIIGLYQGVLDQRDQLISEVTALQSALATSQQKLETSRGGGMERDTRISALEEGNQRLLEENRALAARLTTAQIRRLEAEKILLETQIAWHREQGAADPAATQVSQTGGPRR